MESHRVTLVFVLGLVIGLGGIWWYQSEPPPPSDNSPADTGVVKHKVSGFNLVETTGPDEVWTLTAPRSTRTGDTMNLTEPYVTLRQSGDTTAIITADRGIYNTRSRYLTLKGNVRVRRPRRNQTLTTDVLNWDQSKGTIETDEVVTIDSPERSLKAVGLWADLSEERVRFKSDVKMLSR